MFKIFFNLLVKTRVAVQLKTLSMLSLAKVI